MKKIFISLSLIAVALLSCFAVAGCDFFNKEYEVIIADNMGSDTYLDGKYKNGDNVVLIPHGLEGYTFVQWNFDGVMVSTEREFCFTMKPQLAGTYTAIYQPNKYNLYVSSGADFELSVSGEVEYGTKITLVSEPIAPSGYVRNYYYTRAQAMPTDKIMIDFDAGFYMPAMNIMLSCTINKSQYNINYELNGGSFVGEYKTSYRTSDADYTLPTPVRKGYQFLGWIRSASGDFNPNPNMVIRQGSNEDMIFSAKWQLAQSESGFNAIVETNPRAYIAFYIEGQTFQHLEKVESGTEITVECYGGSYAIKRVYYKFLNSNIEYDIPWARDFCYTFYMPDGDIEVFAETEFIQDGV